MRSAQLSHSAEISPRAAPLLAILLVVDSLHFVFARALAPHLPPAVSAMYVLGVGTLQVGLYGVYRRQLSLAVLGRHLAFFLVIGFLVAGSTVLSYASVAFIDAGTASILGKMTTVFSLLLGIFWLHERLTGQQLAGGAVAIAGVLTIAFQPGDYLRLGSLLVIASTLMYAVHAAVVKRHGGATDFVNFFFYRLLSTTAFLYLFAVARHELAWPDPTTWALLILTGSVDVTLSRSLYYLALRRLPMSVHAIILTVSPVMAIVWAFLLFDTFPSPQQLVGGVLVLGGVLLATVRRGSR